MGRYVTTQQLREAFLRFFRQRGHLIMPSAPLVLDDPTTLFTSAGMQPYIGAFRGEEEPPGPRVASIQKCFRTGDLERVGRYVRYLTFFEMAGNFSFGDYFKKEAIAWGWEFTTGADWLGLDPADLWVTIFETDDEAYEIWHRYVGVPAERIVRFGRKDNWWPQVRWEGPCGPCTEIHLDLGPEFGCGRPDCALGCDCDRFLELWNLVFQMYTEAEDGTLTPLPKPGIDTGMGLERVAMVMQGVSHTFETDELWRIMQSVLTHVNAQRDKPLRYKENPEYDVALRVMTDHARAVAFALADGAVPSNEGAGYVVRRLLRRALRFGRSLGAEQPFLHKVLPSVAEAMGQVYPELAAKQEYAMALVRSEEERFTATLSQGMARFEELAEQASKHENRTIAGRDAFVLYDTYGFPLEMTVELSQERGLTVDVEGFHEAMAEQRQRSGGVKGLALHADPGIAAGLPKTTFTGYEELEGAAEVVALLRGDRRVHDARDGEEVTVILDRTPFYAEAGGQVADTGLLTWPEGRFEVADVQFLGEARAHVGRVSSGQLSVGQRVRAIVNSTRRRATMRHHTATHLLQAALRQVLGQHVSQAGSHVSAERTRFDFTHHEALTEEQIVEVEDLVNTWVLADLPVSVEEVSLEEALRRGAIALFSEKYSETVRLVAVPGVSMELCGGTHVSRTGEIGAFRITSQESVAAGVRRVEAVAGLVTIAHDRTRERMMRDLARELNVPIHELSDRVAALQERIRQLEHELSRARQMRAAANVGELVAMAREVGDVRIVAEVIPGVDRDMLGSLADEIAARLGDGVVVLGSEVDGKVALVAKVSEAAVRRGAHAGELVKRVAELCGGSGGGRPHFAQAGGKDPARLSEALAQAIQIVAVQIGERNA